MKKILLSLLLTIPFIGFGQVWEYHYGGGYSDGVGFTQQTIDGGYIITGFTGSFGDTLGDVYLIKTDGNGIEQWSQTFGAGMQDVGASVQQTTDGGYIITGWTEEYDINSVAPDDIYINVYLIKTDGNGNEQWQETFGGTNYYSGFSVQQTTDGGYIITGEQYSFVNGDWGSFLIKTNGNGDSLWCKNFGGVGPGITVEQTTDGGYITTGSIMETPGVDNLDVCLMKTDGNGDSIWVKTFGGPGNYDDYGHSVQQTTDGGYIITGVTCSFGDTLGDVYLIKTDGNGIEQWSQTFGGLDTTDVGLSIQQTTDGGYIIGGYYTGFGTHALQGIDIYLIKTDSQGNVTSTFNISTSSSNRKLEKVVDVLGREIKPQTNIPFIEIYDDGSIERKIIVE